MLIMHRMSLQYIYHLHIFFNLQHLLPGHCFLLLAWLQLLKKLNNNLKRKCGHDSPGGPCYHTTADGPSSHWNTSQSFSIPFLPIASISHHSSSDRALHSSVCHAIYKIKNWYVVAIGFSLQNHCHELPN